MLDPRRDLKVMVTAYVALLTLSHGASRTRLQSVLAGLRDEIARVEGRSPEEVQNTGEAMVARGVMGDG